MVKPIRILQAFVTGDGGGLTKYICQNYQFVDRDKVQFDFLTFDAEQLPFEREFCDMGARFYRVARPSHPLSFFCALRDIIKNNEYSAVHFHLSYANFVPVLLTKLAGAKKIFIHSHSTQIDDNRAWVRNIKLSVHKLGRMLWPVLVDEYLACSNIAGEWMYRGWNSTGIKFHLASNGIEVRKYSFDQTIRAEKRQELGLTDKNFVIGHIGRFCYQKNQSFLVQVFREYLKKAPDALLFFVGTGEDEKQVRSQVEALGISDKVRFLGRRSDVPELLQAMDVFALPSRFEGLVIVGVEAQAAGLPCIVSDVVSEELALTDLVHFLPINSGYERWVEEIKHSVDCERMSREREIIDSGYDIVNSARSLMDLYLQK